MMSFTSSFRFCLGLCLIVLSLLWGGVKLSAASDIGNCLLCHKYPGLSRVDEHGKFRLLYVNEQIFNKSIHAKVKCEGCHTDVKKIPHDPVKKVDCLTQCHIVEPTSEKKFSHKGVDDFLSASVHGKYDKNGRLKKYPEDLPSCKNCHENPMYRPLSFYKTVRYGISDEALGRCRVCHKKDEFIFTFYNHVSTRLHTTRNPKNLADVCARCHDDPKIMARHDLSVKAVASYARTFHGKAAEHASESAPSCLDCHVNKGQSVHQMLGSEDRASITHKNNRLQACTNMECHPSATAKMTEYNVHPAFSFEKNPYQFSFTAFFITLAGGTLLPLMGLMFMDLIRRIFPNISLKRKKRR